MKMRNRRCLLSKILSWLKVLPNINKKAIHTIRKTVIIWTAADNSHYPQKYLHPILVIFTDSQITIYPELYFAFEKLNNKQSSCKNTPTTNNQQLTTNNQQPTTNNQ